MKTLDMGGPDDALGSDPFAKSAAIRHGVQRGGNDGTSAWLTGGISWRTGGRLHNPEWKSCRKPSWPSGRNGPQRGQQARWSKHSRRWWSRAQRSAPQVGRCAGPAPPGADRGDAGRGEPTPASRFFLGALPAGARAPRRGVGLTASRQHPDRQQAAVRWTTAGPYETAGELV